MTGKRIPLWIRILLLAALNLAILGTVFVAFLRSQLKPELESFLMAEARARIASVTTLIATDLQNNNDISQWSGILDRYSKEYGVTMLLYRNTGEQLAGPAMNLPSEVDARMPRGGPPLPLRDGFSRGPGPRDRGEFSRGPRDERQPRGGRGSGGGPGGPNSPQGFAFLEVVKSSPKYWIGVRMPLIDLPEGERLRSVLMFVSPSFLTNSFFFNVQSWLGVAAGAVLISALCWLPLMRNLTHSISDMMHATEQIAEGRFDVNFNDRRRDEIGGLGAAIKRMAGKLKMLTDGRKRFLGAVAHELRSPIARMQLATEILERNADPVSRKYVDDLKEDIAMMTRLTDELLQFARAESAPESVKLTAVNVLNAAQAAARRESIDGADISIDIDPSLTVRANEEYLIRSLSNLLRNAIRYAGEHGPITISANPDHQRIQIRVSDSGPGVPEDALDKIFTPFFRLEFSRDRQKGGTGLGLAIVKSCVEACGGTVECRNRKPSGLEVTIELSKA